MQQKENMWAIVELPTKIIVHRYESTNVAKKTVHALNRGTGFCGWTPRFFVPQKDRLDAV